ncbi:MAG: rhomboid family intramembrane serine protease [Succinimonas sp.]|nr:rhomboid family intramembrane serine protease [Succinimonas sp.]
MITAFLIAFTVVISLITYPGINPLPRKIRRPEWHDKMMFSAWAVWHRKEFRRLFTHGFIHMGYWHLIVNMLVLGFFGFHAEDLFRQIFGSVAGECYYALLYLLALPVACSFGLVKYRDKPGEYSLGASGATMAVLFAAILLAPGMRLSLMFVPISIPGYLFALLFIPASIAMHRWRIWNVNHMAHVCGAVFGFVFPIMLEPALLSRFWHLV